MPPLRHFRIIIEYDGSRYFGWQTQKDQPTVQETIETALETIVGAPVALHGSGRTDRGAHALGQVASLSCETELPPDRLRSALNGNLPKDIAVLGAYEVDGDFHARFSATAKTYRYQIVNRPIRSPLRRHRAWFVSDPIDVERMREGARHLVGEHDFRAFMKEGSEPRSTVRRVLRLEVERRGDEIVVEVEATGFLYTMVRAFVGCLVRVGRGDWAPDAIREVRDGPDRERVGPNTAPPHGLFLLEVRYDLVPGEGGALPAERG